MLYYFVITQKKMLKKYINLIKLQTQFILIQSMVSGKREMACERKGKQHAIPAHSAGVGVDGIVQRVEIQLTAETPHV